MTYGLHPIEPEPVADWTMERRVASLGVFARVGAHPDGHAEGEPWCGFSRTDQNRVDPYRAGLFGGGGADEVGLVLERHTLRGRACGAATVKLEELCYL